MIRMAGMDLTVDINITHIEPTSSYIEEMELLVGYLYAKSNPSELDKRVIDTFESWRNNLYDGFDNFNIKPDGKPSLELLKGGKP